MSTPRIGRASHLCLVLGLAVAPTAPGCGPSRAGPDAFRGIEAAERYSAAETGRRRIQIEAPPPLSIDGVAVSWDELVPLLAETAGGVVVEELTLDRMLADEAERRGISISDAGLADEREWLGLSVAEGAGLDPTASDDLIMQIRGRRGLGPARFDALLHRNALLRALVRDRVQVRDEQIELAWRVQHGERLRLRLIVTPTQSEAQAVVARAVDGDPARTELRFAALAQEHSTDPSASRGGLIEPVSPEDPAYEQAVRTAASNLQPGQVGPVVAIRNGFAVLYLAERLPPDGVSLEEARGELTDQLQRRQERLLMDELATQLLAEARVRVLDESLNWSVRAGQER